MTGGEGSGRAVRIALTAGVAASFLAAQAGPSNWLWGMNLLRYYPRPFGILWTLAALAAIWFLPDAGAADSRSSRKAPPPPSPSIRPTPARMPPVAVAGLAALGAAIVFIAFRSESLLLGDGMEIIRRLHQGNVPTPRSPLYNMIEPVFFRALSHGDMRLEARAAGALSVVAGVLATGGGTFFLARLASRNRYGAIAAGALLFLTGALQLFFGYVEAYPLLTAATIVFYAAAFDRLSGGDRLAAWAATLAVFFAVGAHPFGVTLVPGWLYLISLKPRDGNLAVDRRRVLYGAAAGLTVFVALFAFFAGRPEFRRVGSAFRYIAPQELWKGISGALATLARPRPWADQYRVFSMVHAADCWNTLWLVGAGALGVIGAMLALREGRNAVRRPPVILAVLSLAGVVMFRALFRTPLGALRDWDLFSGLGLGVAGLAAAFALTTPARFSYRSIAAAAVFFLVPWIGMQTSTGRAATRHFDGVEAEPRPEPPVAAYFHCVMGDRFANLRRYDLAVRAYERALSAWPRYDFAWRLGTMQMISKNYADAARSFGRARQLNPGDEPASVLLAEALMGTGDLARASAVLDSVLAAHASSGAAHLRYAQIKAAQGDFSGAQHHLEMAEINLGTDQPAARQELADLRRQLAGKPAPVPSPGARSPIDRPISPRADQYGRIPGRN